MLKSNFLLFLAIGGLFSLTRVDHTAAAPTKNAANAGSKMLLPTESLQLTDTATNQNLLPMASGQLVSTVNNKNLLPIASSQIADTAKKQTLLPTKSVQISDNLKNLDLLPMESVQIAGKSMNQSLLQMENGKLSNQNLLSLASSQIGKIADNQMKKLEIADTYKNQSLFPMENLQVAESAKSHRLFPFENVPQLAGSTEKQLFLAVPSEVDRVTNNAMKSLDATNDDLPIYDTRLLPLGYKLKASDLRAMPSQPLFNYKRTSHAHMPQYDRFETQKARIDYYRPLSSYREKYYMKKDGRDSDFRFPFLKSNDSVPRELVQNFDNLLAAPKDKEEPDKEITIPLPESAHNATEVQLRVQARARRNYYPGGKLANVCLGKSTVYNKPRVMNWLEKKVYMYYSTDDYTNDVNINYAQERNRPMYFDLRLELFKNGKSEECHIPSLGEWKPYLECALRRNQRMEYMIPMYPLHQIGYKFHWSRSMDESAYNNYRSYAPRTDFKKW